MFRRRKSSVPQKNKAKRSHASSERTNPERPPAWTSSPSNQQPLLTLQRKLIINQPGDEYEQEADRVADQVMRMANPVVQRAQTCACGGEAGPDGECSECKATRLGLQRQEVDEDNDQYGVVQTKSANNAATSAHAPPSVHQTIRSSGQPLDKSTRDFMEPRFGQDFGDVRVHTNLQSAQSAEELHARAYTLDKNIVFGLGEYKPGTRAGDNLIAHELTHVVQQSNNRLRRSVKLVNVHRPAGTIALQSAGLPETRTTNVPEGGTPVNKVGIVGWDKRPQLRLRSASTTEEDNVITSLPFNTHLQVIKRFPGDWYFVSTSDGEMGYVASMYVRTDPPESNAKLHRVEAGLPGTAIAIAERYYGRYADDWGQDLRFYVNVLAWANNISVPNTTSGWRSVRFNSGDLIWIPSYQFARSLRGVVGSGSRSYALLDAVGLAGFVERAGELWDDIRRAVDLSGKYLKDAILRHVTEAIWNVLFALALMLVAAVAILAISTAIGAAIGALAGGVGAAPGAAAGFEIGMVILQWLGLAMLITWIGQAIWETAAAFGSFLGLVWNARGNQDVLDRAARQFAEALGTFLGNVLEAIALYAASKGLGAGFRLLRSSKFGTRMSQNQQSEWLSERVRRVRAGETRIVGPRMALARFFRGTKLVDANGKEIGELDGVDLGRRIIVENKRASGLDRVNPRTGRPEQSPAEWSRKHVFKKTKTRINNIGQAWATRPTPGLSADAPSISQIRSIRHVHFKVDADTPALRAAVYTEMANLRSAHSDWSFTAEFGIRPPIPLIPDTDRDDE